MDLSTPREAEQDGAGPPLGGTDVFVVVVGRGRPALSGGRSSPQRSQTT